MAKRLPILGTSSFRQRKFGQLVIREFSRIIAMGFDVHGAFSPAFRASHLDTFLACKSVTEKDLFAPHTTDNAIAAFEGIASDGFPLSF